MLTLNGSYGNRQKYKTPNRPRGNFNEKENRMKYSLINHFFNNPAIMLLFKC